MARTNNLTNFLTDVAAAIKIKKGDEALITPSNFDTEIINLPSGTEGVYEVDSFQEMYDLTDVSNGDICLVRIEEGSHTGTEYTFVPFNDSGDSIRQGNYENSYFLIQYTDYTNKFLTSTEYLDDSHSYRAMDTLDLESEDYTLDFSSATDSKFFFKLENIKDDMFALVTSNDDVLYNTSTSTNLSTYDYIGTIAKSSVIGSTTYDEQIIKFEDIIDYDGSLVPVYICNTTLCCIRPANAAGSYCWLAGRVIQSGKTQLWVSTEGIKPGVYTYLRQNNAWVACAIEPEYDIQSKSVTIQNNTTTTISPDTGYLLSGVTVTTDVQPKLEILTETVTLNGTTTYTPSTGKDGFSSVEITTQVDGDITAYVAERHATFSVGPGDWSGNTCTLQYSTSRYALESGTTGQIGIPLNSSYSNTANIVNSGLNIAAMGENEGIITIVIQAVTVPTDFVSFEIFGIYSVSA